MSRSYKKYPYYGPKDQDYKKISNRKIRRMGKRGEDLPDGNAYRKVIDPWDICDYSTSITWEDEIASAKRQLWRNSTGRYWIYSPNPRGLTTVRDEIDYKALYRKWWTDYKAK